MDTSSKSTGILGLPLWTEIDSMRQLTMSMQQV